STEDGTLSFTAIVLQLHYTAENSVVDGIYPLPDQHTGGEGPVTAWLASFIVLFNTEFYLPAGHYFFVPQVEVLDPNFGQFYWVSAPRDPQNPLFEGDLQSWIRNPNIEPDWLRIGTDIIGDTTFNKSFSLIGQLYPPE